MNKSLQVSFAILISSVCLIINFDVNDSTVLKPYFFFLFGIISILIWLKILSDKKEIKIEIPNFTFPLLFYLLSIFISIFFSINFEISIFEFLKFTFLILISFVFFNVCKDKVNSNFFSTFFVFNLFLMCLFAIIIDLAKGNIQILTNPKKDFISTLGNSAYFGTFLILFFPLIIGKFLIEKKNIQKKVFFLFSIFICVMLYFSQSNTSYIAFFFEIFFFILLYTKNKNYFLFFFLFILLFFIVDFFLSQFFFNKINEITKHGSTLFRRIEFYKGAISSFFANPIFGNGFQTFEIYYPKFRSNEYWINKSEDIVSHTHNEFLEILSESGIIGFVLFAFFLFVVFRFGIKKIKTEKIQNQKVLIISIMIGILGTIIDNFGNMSLRTLPIQFLFYLMIVFLFSFGEKNKIIVVKQKKYFHLSLKIIFILALIFIVFETKKTNDKFKSEKFFLAGFLEMKNNNLKYSLQNFQNAYKYNEDNIFLTFNYAAVLLQNNEFATSKILLNKLEKRSPYYPKLNLLKQHYFYNTNQFDSVKFAFEKEITLRNHPSTLDLYANFLKERNEKKNEIKILHKIILVSLKANNLDYVEKSLNRLLEIENKNKLKLLPFDKLKKLNDKKISNTIKKIQKKLIDIF